MDVDGYHESRFQFDPRRAKVWKTLIEEVFQSFVPPRGTVLELGAGFCDFINQVVAARKYAVDLWPQLPNFAAADVEPIVGAVTDLSRIPDRSVDVVFASNLFEHLDQDEFASTLAAVRKKLTAAGCLVVMQPNFRYASAEYFDDYTHKAIWSHVSIVDFLKVHGFDAVDVRPKFLPLTMKSRMPPWRILIKLYLASPVKIMGKQMLVVARPSGGGMQ